MKRVAYLFWVVFCSFVLVGCGGEGKKTADYWIEQGNKAFEEKDYRTAFLDAEEALKIDSKSVGALELRARVFYDKFCRNYALRDINKVIELDPKRTSAYCYRTKFEGESFDDLYHDTQAAIKDLTKAIEIEPANAKIYSLRSRFYYKEKQNDLALQDINKAIEITPNDPDLYVRRANYQKNPDKMQDLDKAIELAPNKEKYRYYDLRAYRQESKDRKRADFEKALELATGETKAEYYVIRYGGPTIDDYNKAIEVATDKAKYYATRANYYKKQKNQDAALADYAKAIELAQDKDKAKYYQQRAEYYKELKENSLALQDFNKIIELAPNDATAYLMRGENYSKDKKYDLALKDFDKAIEVALEYEKAKSYNRRASTYVFSKKLTLAIADLSKVIELNCDASYTVDAYFARGLYHDRMGEHEKAMQDWKKANEINPEYDPLGRWGP